MFVDLANHFTAIGMCVDLTLASAQGPYLQEVSPAVRVVDFGESRVLRCLPRLARYLRSERPSVILSGLDHANIVTVLAHALSRSESRCVVSMRSVPSAVYGGATSAIDRLILTLIRHIYPFADAIIANSEAVASDFVRLVRARGVRPTVIYNPMNIPLIQQLGEEEPEHPWFDRKAAPVILGVGSLTAIKDFSTLLRAFSIVRASRECRLIILGEGPERSKLESLIRGSDYRDDVWLPGFVSNPFPWMRRANVFVSASVTEGCPNALMQALACGAHVIGTDCVGGSAEILEGGKWGSLVAVGDTDALAREILRKLNTPRNPHVRERAEAFSLGSVGKQYLQVLLPNYTVAAVER